MENLRFFATRAAACRETVLLMGETGSGKDLLAQLIHGRAVAGRPFVKIDCGAIAPTIMESELFGHEKGSFTGAIYRKKGIVEVANGGTVFFNEVGNLDRFEQAKFLGLLDDRVVRHVGGTAEIPVEVRVIAATNADLERSVKEGRFREDLYHRLYGLVIEVPPLRMRRADIPELASHFLRQWRLRYEGENGREVGRAKRLSSPALELVMEYRWPGNVRELKHAVERAAAFGEEEEITADDLQPHLKGVGVSTFPTFEENEKRYLMEVLLQCGGIQRDAAELAGITPRVMSYKLKTLGLTDYARRLREGRIENA